MFAPAHYRVSSDAFVNTYMHAYTHIHIHTCSVCAICAHYGEFTDEFVNTYMHAETHTHIYTYIPAVSVLSVPTTGNLPMNL
jgi:hypothetical protein